MRGLVAGLGGFAGSGFGGPVLDECVLRTATSDAVAACREVSLDVFCPAGGPITETLVVAQA